MSIHASNARSGFSLMEIMIVITLIGLFLAVGGPALFRYLERGKVTNAKQAIHGFKQAIDQYNMDTNAYPQNLSDLIKAPAEEKIARNWKGPYYNKKTVPKDPWGKKYEYVVNTDNAEHPYELFSYGGLKGKAQPKKDRISVWDEE